MCSRGRLGKGLTHEQRARLRAALARAGREWMAGATRAMANAVIRRAGLQGIATEGDVVREYVEAQFDAALREGERAGPL